ncbi:MAG TPA: hypothetical protein PKD00_08890 [Burkholderiales bacterium]|nr:hypothetical protein [Burkholderiales bacterium]
MNKVSISEAVRMAGVSRSHFYKKYINTGEISIVHDEDKKLIDVSELIRIFGNIQIEDTKKEQLRTIENSMNTHDKDKLISVLEKQLNEALSREKEALERENWLKSQLEKTTALIEDKTAKKRKKFLGLF